MNTVSSTAIRYTKSETEPIAQQLWSMHSALTQEHVALGRSQMVYAVNEITKAVLNWIGKGQEDQLANFASELDRFLSIDEELDDPLIGVSQKRKFGANLAFLLELINVYRHSDLELKDYHQIMLEGKVSNRLRRVLMVFFSENRRLNSGDLLRLIYTSKYDALDSISENNRKLVQRDLDTLVKLGLVQRIVLGLKKYVYEVTPRANSYKNEIMHRELGMKDYLLTQPHVFVGSEGSFPNQDLTVSSLVINYLPGNT